MRVLYVDISLQGHRLVYLKAFEEYKPENIEGFCLLPEKNENLKMPQLLMKSGFDKNRTIKTYFYFLKEIRSLINEYQIDLVHFLCGDALYRFMGIGLRAINCKVVITYHHMVFTKLKSIAIKNLFAKSSYGVVHTDSLYHQLKKMSINNVECIFYPMFDLISNKDIKDAKEYFGLEQKEVVLGVIGGTQRYKGLDILLECLNMVKNPCVLFVAGVERDFSREYIMHKVTNDLVHLHLVLRGLTDEEFADAVQASDIILLPYRKEFDGASGPLVTAAMHNKPIIAANHGSLGDMVTRYKLGVCFESENAASLANVLDEYIKCSDTFDIQPKEFRDRVTREAFLNSYRKVYKDVLSE